MRRFFSLVLLATLVFSCNKLELLEHSNTLDAGCLNPNATNYDAAAPSDDGSCTFGNCSITSVSTTEYTLVCPTQTTFSYGDSYILGLNVGQVTSAELFLNETAIYSFGNWLTFPSSERTFSLPAPTTIQPSNCYTIRISLYGLLAITEPFTIY